jgi:hypothetical protein
MTTNHNQPKLEHDIKLNMHQTENEPPYHQRNTTISSHHITNQHYDQIDPIQNENSQPHAKTKPEAIVLIHTKYEITTASCSKRKFTTSPITTKMTSPSKHEDITKEKSHSQINQTQLKVRSNSIETKC